MSTKCHWRFLFFCEYLMQTFWGTDAFVVYDDSARDVRASRVYAKAFVRVRTKLRVPALEVVTCTRGSANDCSPTDCFHRLWFTEIDNHSAHCYITELICLCTSPNMLRICCTVFLCVSTENGLTESCMFMSFSVTIMFSFISISQLTD